MVRNMTRGISALEAALLGLLNEEPMSGYALRKMFMTTPMGHFSDSPGSIYPALARLGAQGFVQGAVENARSLRPRKIYRVTPRGLARLEAWLGQPVTRQAVAGRFDLLLLRFVFMPRTIGLAASGRFLTELEHETAAYLADLRAVARAAARHMPLAGRLGLRAGIETYAAYLRWARLARRTIAKEQARGTRSRS